MAALISAIEVYNKPTFAYREETFAILAINAWELLLKAKLLQDNGNKIREILVWDSVRKKDGTRSKKKIARRNRSGNQMTIGLTDLLTKFKNNPQYGLSPKVIANLEALLEVRDNAVHFMNASPQLAKAVLELGTASVQNFAELSAFWFGDGLDRYRLYLMPIAFVPAPSMASVKISQEEIGLLGFLSSMASLDESREDGRFRVSLTIDVELRRGSGNGAVSIAERQSEGEGAAVRLVMSEDEILRKYPWTYSDLVQHLRNRYVDFKQDKMFHDIRKKFLGDSRYVWSRRYNPVRKDSPGKYFYNPNIVKEFDGHYKLHQR